MTIMKPYVILPALPTLLTERPCVSWHHHHHSIFTQHIIFLNLLSRFYRRTRSWLPHSNIPLFFIPILVFVYIILTWYFNMQPTIFPFCAKIYTWKNKREKSVLRILSLFSLFSVVVVVALSLFNARSLETLIC